MINTIAVVKNRSPEPRSADVNGDGIPDECEGPAFKRGDGNADEQADLSDALFVLNYLFPGGIAPTCEDAADADDN